MTTICAETVNCNNLITSNNKVERKIGKVGKVSFDNVNNASASAFLKHAGFFQVKWPANCVLSSILVIITGNNIVMGNTDDTILCMADGTNAILGTSTNIVMNEPYGAAIDTDENVIADQNSHRTSSCIGPGTIDKGMLSSSDRTITGVIFHDADGVTDGGGDGATHVSGLDTAVIYVILSGYNLN